MQPREAGIRFWLDPVPPEEMPVLAARMLAGGHDTPALRRAAGGSRRDDPRDIRQELGQALGEQGAWPPRPRRRRAGSRHVPGARTAQRGLTAGARDARPGVAGPAYGSLGSAYEPCRGGPAGA